MTDATMTPDSGNALASPSTDLNDPANLDFEDESETQTTGQEQGAEVDPDRETDEGREPQESDSESDETAENSETEETDQTVAEVNIPDDALVTLSNGEKVKFSDLKKSPLLEADYTRGKQILSNERKSVAEQAKSLASLQEALVDFLAEQLPPEPSLQLAMEDAPRYTREKAFHDAAVARLQVVLQNAEKAKGVSQQMSDAEINAARAEAAQVVADRLPFLRDPVRAKEFDKSVAEAASFIGYSEQDVARMTDPRQFLLAHYAAKGIKAEQAEKKVQQKVQAAPPAAPAKTAQQKGNPQFLRNKEAMRRLSKSGSIHDAMQIDFE